MSLRYYSEKIEYPEILRAIDDRIAVYICGLLYPTEDIEDSLERYIVSDIGAGGEIDIGDSSEISFVTNANFPFTAVQWGPIINLEEGKHYLAHSGSVYSPCVDAMVKTKPMQTSIQMVTFFGGSGSWRDYLRALRILHNEADSLIRLSVPVILNGVATTVPIDIEFEISEGTYTSQFEQWLAQGEISDIVHAVNVTYWDITLDTGDVHAIDDMEIFMSYLSDVDVSLGAEIDEFSLPDPPEVDSVVPVDEAEDVDPDATVTSFIFTFSEAMDEDTVRENFTILPYVSGDFVWDDYSKIFTYDLTEDMQAATEYLITITNDAKSTTNTNMVEDFEYSITTGA